MFKGQFIVEGDGLYTCTTHNFFRGGLPGISRTLKANVNDASVCVRYETMTTMKTMKQRDFHKQVRVVYRALRKIYGKVKTQDEALRIFKIVFPEKNKVLVGEQADWHIPQTVIDGIKKLRDEWQPTGEFAQLFDKVINQMEMPVSWENDVLVKFYDDIMPVVMRIRKLTPTETGRLMDLRDEEIQKMYDAGLSNSAMYKLHGNSVVVACMYHIFDKLFIHREKEYKPGTQLTIF